MPEYLAPGVYVEEIANGARPIPGVSTNAAAFLGETERGPLHAQLLASYAEYQAWFGLIVREDCYLPYAARGFFENGGDRLYVCRIVGKAASAAFKRQGSLVIRANGPGAWGNRVWVRVQDGTTMDSSGNSGFRLKVAYWSSVPAGFHPYDPSEPANAKRLPRPTQFEDCDDLQIDPTSPDYFEKRLVDPESGGSRSTLITIEPAKVGTTRKPRLTAARGTFLNGGSDDPAGVGAEDFAGVPAGARVVAQGLEQLRRDALREVAIVYAPFAGRESDAIARRIIEHCEQRRCFALIDGALEPDWRSDDPRHRLRDTSYAAYYQPWLQVVSLAGGAPVWVPPGGHVIGVYARNDAERGAFKSPVNVLLLGALNLSSSMDDYAVDGTGERGVNAIRYFPQAGIRVWSARTLSSDPLWRYVSLRRYFIFLERSIDAGIQWVVFEPNDERLWARVQDTVRLFLRAQWRAGALLGDKEEEALFVRCDRSTMTQDDILNGRLICEIGIAPVRPAEFVILRITASTAQAQR